MLFVLIALLASGMAWPHAALAQPEVHHIHGLALDQRDPDLLYVATHTGLVLLRTGKEPEWIGAHRFDLMGFTAHPLESGVMFASGHPDLATYRKDGVGNLGLLMSRDAGRTWQSISLKGETDFHALTWNPRDGGQLYGWSVASQPALYRISAATGSAQRLPGRGLSGVLALSAGPDPNGPLLAGTRTGLLVSRDAGVSWESGAGVPAGAVVPAVAHHATDAKVVYAYFARSGGGALGRSGDGGNTWEMIGLPMDPSAVATALAVGPGDHVALATTSADIMRSRDGGRTWEAVLRTGRPAAGKR